MQYYQVQIMQERKKINRAIEELKRIGTGYKNK